MSSLGHHIPPPCPEEIVLWLRSQEISSNRLRIEGHGKSVGNNLAAAANEEETAVNDNIGFAKFSGLNTTPDSIKSKGL